MPNATKINLEENKESYVEKMSRQIKDARDRVFKLENTADDRSAKDNPEIKARFDRLQMKLNEVEAKFKSLEGSDTDSWPQSSQEISIAYKELEGLITEVETKVKPK